MGKPKTEGYQAVRKRAVEALNRHKSKEMYRIIFEALSPDTQQTIHRMGVVDGSIDMTGYEAWRAKHGST